MRRLFAAMLLLGLLSACGSATGINPPPSPSPSPSPSASPSPSPTASPTSSPTPASSPSPSPSPTAPAGFVCGSASGGSVADSTVTTTRVGQHPGYDRFVIEFGGGAPSYTVTPQGDATFTRSPRGDQVTLEGTGGVLIVVHSVTNWTSYSGPTAFHPGYPFLRQALLVENFEGYQQWALGIQGSPCVRVGVFSSPSRLVVDVVGL